MARIASKTKSKAERLKKVLIGVLVVVVVAFAGTFYVSLQILREYATEVNRRLQDADASGSQVQQLQTLKNQLSQSQVLVDKANSLFATQDNYQSQILTDIRNHASAAGVSVASTEFDPESDGTNQRAVTVKLGEPVEYSKFVAFLSGIESNVPKMQVSSVTLGHIPGGSSESVTVGDIKINISVR